MKVAIGALTYRRPQGLARLLEGLSLLAFAKEPEPEIVVVVVDNDPEGSARRVCDEWREKLSWPLRYEHETRRGVSQARNRAVAVAREGFDFLAFIDDDEVPDPRWLDELLAVQREYDADVVSGPVPRIFEGAVPAWVERGRFFKETRLPTGAAWDQPGAGNVLIRTAALDGLEAPFDERFALTGGEDTHLFLRLGAAGRRMVWADEAVAYEWVPTSRASARWILQRVYRTSSTWSICEREIRPSPRYAAIRAAKGVYRFAYGLVRLPFASLFGRHEVVRSLWYMCWGAGNIIGLAGLTYREYRNTHGR